MKVLRDCKDPSTFEVLCGGCVLGVFVLVWVGSLGSPLLLLAAIRFGWYWTAGALLVLSVAAYIPWKKGFVSKMVTNVVDYYHPRYYHSCKTIVHPDAEPTSTTTTTSPKKLFYAVHPHGAFCLGWSTLFHSPKFSSCVRFCFSPALYASPLFRLWCRLTGRPGKADKKSMVHYMKNKGEHVALPPGGFEEATLTCLTQDRAYIRKRAGFVKLCLQHGYQVVPVYCFGEKNTYWNLQGAWGPRLALNGLGVPAILISGLAFLPFIPRRTSLLVAAGAPLACPHIPNPTREDVKLWHGKYMSALQQLYDQHKSEAYGHEVAKTSKLELW